MKVEKKKKSRSDFLVICTLILVLLMLLLFSCGLQKSPQVLAEYEQKVDEITEIDYEERQKAVDTLVEEGRMNVNYSAKATFRGMTSEQFQIKNIQNNHDAIVFNLYDENGDCIYASKRIAPGFEMNAIQLTKELSKGEHACKIKISYAKEGNVASVFPITIEVR